MTKIGNKFLVLFLAFLAVLFLAENSSAQTQTKVEATVDREQMALGDAFTLSVSISSDEDFEADPKLPQLKGIEVINAWAAGKSYINRAINFKFTKEVKQTFNFMLSPNKEGKLIIPVIDVAVGDKTYKTQPLTIDVAEEYRGGGAGAGAKGNKRPGRAQLLPGLNEDDPFGDDNDIFSQMMRERERILGQLSQGGGAGGNPFGGSQGGTQNIPQKNIDVNPKEAFFIYLESDRTEAYEGQQITANWYIYVRGQIESLDRTKFPDLKGFWKEIIEEVPSLQFTPEVVNGIVYQKALLASHALFPIKPGIAVIDEFKIKARTRMPTPFGMGKPHEYTKVSKRSPIKVLPLPAADKPLNFSGAVGSFQATVRTEGAQFPAHQPFSVKVRFEGSGNAKLIDLPNIVWPENLEVFDTKSEAKFFKNGQSYKEFEILLIPRKEGQMIIPSFEFSHFNPESKKYVTAATDPVTLQITAGAPGATASSQIGTGAKAGMAANGEPVFVAQPIIEMPEASSITQSQRFAAYFAVFIISLFGIGFNFFRQYLGLKKEPTLDLIIDKKIKQVQHYFLLTKFRQVGAEGVNLVYSLAAYLSGQKTADTEWQKIIENMPLKMKEKFLYDLTSSFEYFQLIGFAPDAVHSSVVTENKTSLEIAKLKKLAEEISLELKKNENA